MGLPIFVDYKIGDSKFGISIHFSPKIQALLDNPFFAEYQQWLN
jgi:hypothetical protein